MRVCIGVIMMVVILVRVLMILASLLAADWAISSGSSWSSEGGWGLLVGTLRRLLSSSWIGHITCSVSSSPLN